MPSAELIAIGTELLLGEIQDTNTRFLARQLRNSGIDLYRSSLIGDNQLRIVKAIEESLGRADIVITTGGLGPTVDDPTREAIAKVFNVKLIFQDKLWDEIQERFLKRGITPSENNKRQAYIPEGAIVIHNPVGTAPAFIIRNGKNTLVCLPGVPKEMEYLFINEVHPFLEKEFPNSGVIVSRVIHTSGLGESLVDEKVADLEILPNPTVGLLAHPGIVDIRITSKSLNTLEANASIDKIEKIIFSRLQDYIFGVDEETLLSAVESKCKTFGLFLTIQSSGFFFRNLPALEKHKLLHFTSNSKETIDHLNLTNNQSSNQAFLTCQISNKDRVVTLQMTFIKNEKNSNIEKVFSGPSEMVQEWAENNCLDFVFKNLP
jgi:nicotinamide-nucleotide amidase